jgi:hypothetical protein
MAFRISAGCKNWFSHLSGKDPLKRIFDYYYLCAILGIAARHKRTPDAEAEEFVDDFISSYKPYQRRIIGLLTLAYLEDTGIGLNEKDVVAQKFSELVTTETSSNLTDKGFGLLNSYTQGGFEILSEEMDKPHDIVFFLAKYQKLLEDRGKGNPFLSEDHAKMLKGAGPSI